MNKKHKAYLKLNIMSLFFVVVSFISITLAWFAYSGFANVETEVDVKAWYIDFKQDDESVSNDIVISLSEIYPGMETISEKINIQNLGDSDAEIKYEIKSARIFNEEIDISTLEEGLIEDKLSQQYPFHINIGLSDYHVAAQTGASEFEVSVSWPLEADNDELDSVWGNAAYEFQKSEEAKKLADPNYDIRTALKIVISVTAEQYLENNESPDPKYELGETVLYDVVNNKPCNQLSSTCLTTYVIDTNNKLGDVNVTLLPSLYRTYEAGTYNEYDNILNNITADWTVSTRPLVVQDLLNIISNDVIDSKLIRNNLSDVVIGNLNYQNRMDTMINNTINYNGYFSFNNQRFSDLSSTRCYWIDSQYGTDKAFALEKVNDTTSRIYGNDINNSCSIIPVIIVSKSNLNMGN